MISAKQTPEIVPDLITQLSEFYLLKYTERQLSHQHLTQHPSMLIAIKTLIPHMEKNQSTLTKKHSTEKEKIKDLSFINLLLECV